MDGDKNQTSLVHNSIKKKKRKRKRVIDLTNTEGLQKISLNTSTLEDIGVVLGSNLTIAKPWCFVKTKYLIENLDLSGSEFSAIKKGISEFSKEEMLLLHVLDEEKQLEDYYLCTSEESTNMLVSVLQKQQEEQQARLANSVFKTARPWMSLGSEKEVDESISCRRRCLREIVIQSAYPITKSHVKFRVRNADENTNHGYMELTTEEGQLDTLIRKRQDVGVQATKLMSSVEAQTKLVYPKNAAMQYQYDVDPHQNVPESLPEKVTAITENDTFSLHDFLEINHHINLYSNDYLLLCRGKCVSSRKSMNDARECDTFHDVEMCKGKMVSSVAWHHIYKEVVAISYCDIKSLLYTNEVKQSDETDSAMHDNNPVYLWAMSDPVSPKILLESQREIEILSFCPFNGNILIGGCVNGQVLLWDLKYAFDLMSKGERQTSQQVVNRETMLSLMGWTKKMMMISHVAVTASSDLKYSHTSPIVSIEWIPGSKEVTDVGKILLHNETHETILQFATASLDGSVKFWNLRKQQNFDLDKVRYKVDKSNTKQKPSGLIHEVSQLKYLHGVWKPIYTVNIWDVNTSSMVAISSLDLGYCGGRTGIRLGETAEVRKHLDTVEEPLQGEQEFCSENKFAITSIGGEHMRIHWGEENVDSDEEETKPYANVTDYAMYHDGPITSLTRSDICDITLTTGGCIFAIWNSEIKNQPLIWRKRSDVLSAGSFNAHQPTMFYILTARGIVEVWNIHCESKKPIDVRQISDNALTQLVFQSNGIKSYMLGLADAYGSFRIFVQRNIHRDTEKDKVALNDFIQREIERKYIYSKWQEKWNAENRKPNEQCQKTKYTRISGVKERIRIIDKMRSPKTNTEKSRLQKYMERAYKKDEKYTEISIFEMIADKKKSDREELVEKKLPLQILKEETEKKKRKMRLVKRNSEESSADAIEVAFPAIVAEEQPPPPDPHVSYYTVDQKYKCFQNYERAVRKAVQVMEANPFSYVFDVKETIRSFRRKQQLKRNSMKTPRLRNRQ